MPSTEAEKELEGKTPVLRGEGAHEQTFERHAIADGETIPIELTDIGIKHTYSPYFFYPHGVSPESVLTRGTAKPLDTVHESYTDDGDWVASGYATMYDPEVHIQFDLPNGETRHAPLTVFRCDHWDDDGLGEALYTARNKFATLSPDNPLSASFEPTSETGGNITINGTTRSRSVTDGPTELDRDGVDRLTDWFDYTHSTRNQETGWIPTTIQNVYDSADGDELTIRVDAPGRPHGDGVVFTFAVADHTESPYWRLITETDACGDPANLHGETVYLDLYTNHYFDWKRGVDRELDVIGVDADNEWVLAPTRPESTHSAATAADTSSLASPPRALWTRARELVHRARPDWW